MRKIVVLIAFIPTLLFSQDNNQNWVKSIVYKKPTSQPFQNPTADQAEVNVVYFDGLGRPIQQIASKQSGNGTDLITSIEYDVFGRRQIDYLPYSSQTGDMIFESNPWSWLTQQDEYIGQLPYSQKDFDGSPFNRVMQQSAPGTANNWGAGSGNEITFEYSANSASDDQVKHFKSTATWYPPDKIYTTALSEETLYHDNTLYKNKIVDENGNVSESFKNQKGQVILKRSFDSGARRDTYYVYDQYNNLSFVIPPKAHDPLDGDVLQNLCYQYRYDFRDRLVEKKQPGHDRQWEFIIYDKLDRIVVTGPAFSPYGGDETTQGYLFTRYDSQSRVAYTGWYSESPSVTRAQIQNNYDGAVTNASKTTNKYIDGVEINYTDDNYPFGLKLLTVNYYDDYSFPGAPMDFITPVAEQAVHYNNTTRKPIGLPTGSWVRVLENAVTAQGQVSYILYDYRGRAIGAYNDNYLSGYTKAETKFNFAGQPIFKIIHHKRLAIDPHEIETLEEFSFTDQGRLSLHTHTTDSNITMLLSQNSYTSLGRLYKKDTGGIYGVNPYQSIDYSYNIRGWLTGINDIYDVAPERSDLFALSIKYDTVEGGVNNVDALYNGNISETYWRSKADNILRKYGYEYDSMNRLLAATYQKPDAPNPIPDSYNEVMSYDENGNIGSLQRNGNLDVLDLPLPIDNLEYSYEKNSDELLSVTDHENHPQGFKDNVNGAPGDIDYDYDANGNLKKDNNKGITKIYYNHMNLPTTIEFGTHKILYIYTASGDKVRKVVQTGAEKKTDYLDGFQYLNGLLQFFPTAEGYVNNTVVEGNNKYNYVYQYKDHLGNIRLNYGVDPQTGMFKILQQNHYYPYGLKHMNYNSELKVYAQKEDTEEVELKEPTPGPGSTTANINNYKFNGMEWQDELGLNLYDMDMRDYDPAIGRWTGMDPVTHFDQSPYMAMNGNPVLFADPSGADGVEPEPINTWHYAGTASTNTFLYGGAGNLGNGDHMLGGSGDEFWGNETAYTGGELSWSNYFSDNSSKTKGVATAGSLSEGEILDQEDPKFMSEQQRMNYEINKFLLNAVLVVEGAAAVSAFRWKAIFSVFTKTGVTIEEAVLQKFIKHAFANGRHSDLGMSVGKITTNTAETISKNFSRLKTGDNTLHLTINGVQKTIMVNVQNGAVRSMNMYSGVSSRVTQGTLIELGTVKW